MNRFRLGRIERYINLTSSGFNWITCIVIAAMLLLTVIDLIGLKVFRWSFAGAFEITGILGLLIISCAISYTYVTDGHTRVDFFILRLPRRLRSAIAVFITLCGLALFVTMSWQMYAYGHIINAAGAVTAIERIPLSPFAFVAAACSLLLSFVLLIALLKAVKGAIKNR